MLSSGNEQPRRSTPPENSEFSMAPDNPLLLSPVPLDDIDNETFERLGRNAGRVIDRSQAILGYLAGSPEEGYISRRALTHMKDGRPGWIGPERLITDGIGIDVTPAEKKLSRRAFKELESKGLIKVERVWETAARMTRAVSVRLDPTAVAEGPKSYYVTDGLRGKVTADIEGKSFKEPDDVKAVSRTDPRAISRVKKPASPPKSRLQPPPSPQSPTNEPLLSDSDIGQIALNPDPVTSEYPTIPTEDIDREVAKLAGTDKFNIIAEDSPPVGSADQMPAGQDPYLELSLAPGDVEDEMPAFEWMADLSEDFTDPGMSGSKPAPKPRSELTAAGLSNKARMLSNSAAIARAIRKRGNDRDAFRAPNPELLHQRVGELVHESDVELVEQVMRLMQKHGFVRLEVGKDARFKLTPVILKYVKHLDSQKADAE